MPETMYALPLLDLHCSVVHFIPGSGIPLLKSRLLDCDAGMTRRQTEHIILPLNWTSISFTVW